MGVLRDSTNNVAVSVRYGLMCSHIMYLLSVVIKLFRSLGPIWVFEKPTMTQCTFALLFASLFQTKVVYAKSICTLYFSVKYFQNVITELPWQMLFVDTNAHLTFVPTYDR